MVFEDLRIAPPKPLPPVLTRRQVAAVLAAVHTPRLHWILTFIYHTGLPVDEAVRARGARSQGHPLRSSPPGRLAVVSHQETEG
jgi:integrase